MYYDPKESGKRNDTSVQPQPLPLSEVRDHAMGTAR